MEIFGYFDKKEWIEIKVNQNSSDGNFAKSQVFLYSFSLEKRELMVFPIEIVLLRCFNLAMG